MKLKDWRIALHVFDGMQVQRMRADIVTFNAALACTAKAKLWACAMVMFQKIDIDSRLSPDIISYNTIISACKFGHQWPASLFYLADMRQRRLHPDVVSVSSAITACEKGQQWEMSITLLQNMKSNTLQPNAISLSAAISACAKVTQWNLAFGMLDYFKNTLTVRPDVVMYNSVIAACKGEHRWVASLFYLSEMENSRIYPDVVTLSSVITACEKGHQWRLSLSYLNKMLHDVLKPNVITLSAAISACDKGHRWEHSLEILSQILRQPDLDANVVTYNAAISACGRGEQWRTAIALLAKISCHRHVLPNVITFSAAITACEKGHEWAQALALFATLRHQEVASSIITYNALISACEKGHKWDLALDLLMDMQACRYVPNVVTYNAAISACEKGVKWEHALCLMNDMSSWRVIASVITYNACILTCSRAHTWIVAISLLEEMLDREIRPDVISCCILLMECEQHNLLDIEVQMLSRLGSTGEVRAAAINAACVRLLRAQRYAQMWELLKDAAFLNAASQSLSDACANFIAVEQGELCRFSTTAKFLTIDSTTDTLCGSAYQKEFRLLQHVFANAERGDAASVCAAMESFGEAAAESSSLWLKVAGGAKADILASALRGTPRECKVLEIGTYCGYSAIRIVLTCPGASILTLEVDPVHMIIARNILLFAGVSHVVTVLTGHSQYLLPRLHKQHEQESLTFDAVFMDQRGSRYDDDLDMLECLGLLSPGAVIVADNVLKPGAPLFLWKMSTNSAYMMQIVAVREFAMPAEDWMSICIFQSASPKDPKSVSEQSLGCRLSVPEEILHLHAEADRMRKRAVNRNQSVTFAEWARFAANMRERLKKFGIQAVDFHRGR